MRYLVSIFWGIAIVLIVVFVALNSHRIELNYYVGKTQIYLPLLLCISTVLGILFGVLGMLPAYWRAKSDRRKIKKLLSAAQQESDLLRQNAKKDDRS